MPGNRPPRPRLFVATVRFINRDRFPAQPLERRVEGENGGYFDFTEQEEFLEQWSKHVFEEYLGSNFPDYHSSTLTILNENIAEIRLILRSPEELEKILQDDRVVRIEHAGDPMLQILEISL